MRDIRQEIIESYLCDKDEDDFVDTIDMSSELGSFIELFFCEIQNSGNFSEENRLLNVVNCLEIYKVVFGENNES
jgi:hypothetical protein